MENIQFNNRITTLFGVQYPIIQAGMVWCSGWRLASAVSNAGALGIIGAGSMRPDVLREHIVRTKEATTKPFAVNVPLIYPDIDKLMQIVVEQGVQIVFTSAGNPGTWTPWLKENGGKVIHVVSSVKFGLKAQDVGADAVVGEGFEAGGHNGREETTTFCLIPMLQEKLDIPIIAAGGVYSGRSMLAAFALGAEGVQIGTRFAASVESSAHDHFKQKICEVEEGQTELVLKKLNPVRMVKNTFYQQVKELEMKGASAEELKNLLGKGRSKRGIFEGDLEEGELEIGQIAAMVNRSETAIEVVQDIVNEYFILKKYITL
jgi:enoyl-[acyl-carrier protein] reductase II